MGANGFKRARSFKQASGFYILHILSEKYGKHRIGLYRDDGLGCFRYTSGPQADRTRKGFIKIFKEDFDLTITCKTNLKAVNFLDDTLNCSTLIILRLLKLLNLTLKV